MAVDSHEPGAPAEAQSSYRRGEPRWPMALAVLGAGTLQALLPKEVRVFDAPWVIPAVIAALLASLILVQPGRLVRQSVGTRVLTELLIGDIALSNGAAVVKLVNAIVFTSQFNNAGILLGSGVALWLTNVIAFALWYWDLDRGGAAARAGDSTIPPAFVFPEMANPDFAQDGWYPWFVDYFQLAFGTGTAFSPTDVSPVKHWSKTMMMVEEAICLVIAVLVVARAVNIMR